MKNLTVMLVEDSNDDEVLAIWVLHKTGVENIVVARDGCEALTLLHGNTESGLEPGISPDIIFLDLRLPKIDGLDVLRKIRSDDRTKNLLVYVLTSSDDPHDREVCSGLGVSGYISKPLTEKTAQSLLHL